MVGCDGGERRSLARRNGGGGEDRHFRVNNPRKKPFRFTPPWLSIFSEPGGNLRAESSAENLGNRLLASLSFFGVLMKEVMMLQPVACDMEREFIVAGILGTSGAGGSNGTVAGDGAVNGRLRMGRIGFVGFLTLSPLSSVWVIP